MGNQAKLRPVAISLRLNEQYFIGRMLMRRERLTRAQWDVFAATADTICDGLLERMPVHSPESAAWDNRRGPHPAADRSSPSPGGA
jgi:hypothetical protein